MDKEIEKFIIDYPDWYVEEGQLVAGFEFKDFQAVKKAVGEILLIADEQNHHPTVTFGYNTIEIKTVTHDAGDIITDKDFALAKAISEVVSA